MNTVSLERYADRIKHARYYETFRHSILGINEHARGESVKFSSFKRTVGLTDFTEGNSVVGPHFFQAMPAGADKNPILKRAFRIANQPDADRAMTLGTAIVMAHPFIDGNGRTSRFVHAVHADRSVQEIIDSELFALENHSDACQYIDLSPPEELVDFVESTIYSTARIPRVPFRPVFYNYDLDEHVPFEAQLAITENEMDQARNCMRFGLNALHASGISIPIAYEQPDIANPEEIQQVVDYSELSANLSKKSLKMFLAKTREYRRRRAETWIDCASPNSETGKQWLTLDNSTTTVAQHFLRLTNNLVKPIANESDCSIA